MPHNNRFKSSGSSYGWRRFIRLTAADPAKVTESGMPAAKAIGVVFLRQGNGAAIYETRSGKHSFPLSQ
jgi:hypothetical protein